MADGGLSTRRVTPGEIDRAILGHTRGLDFGIDVPGTHYSGLAYNHLLSILADQGKDFAANTATLRRHAATVCRLTFEGATRLPTTTEIENVISAAVIDWIKKRFRYEVRDERIRLNTNAYQHAKRKAGFSGPVGVRTGALLEAVDRARVILH